MGLDDLLDLSWGICGNLGHQICLVIMMTPRQVCHAVSSGDLLACLGKGPVSDLIRVVSPNHTHVALVVNSRPAIVAESTAGSTIPDMETGQITVGVQAHFLSDWLDAYDGSVWLLRRSGGELTDTLSEQLASWMETQHRNKVGYDFAGVMKLGVHRIIQMLAQPDAGSLFCSELVVKAYQAIGLLPITVKADEVTPDDCCNWPMFEAPVQLK